MEKLYEPEEDMQELLELVLAGYKGNAPFNNVEVLPELTNEEVAIVIL